VRGPSTIGSFKAVRNEVLQPLMEVTMRTIRLDRAIVGVAGMVVGAALVTLLRIAAAEGVEHARERHLAEVASGPASGLAVTASSAPLVNHAAHNLAGSVR
jgi:hypothetical protein